MSEVRYFYGNSYVSDLWAPRDIVAEGAYLRPSVSNAAVICQWMTKIAGTYSQQHFWSNGFSSNSFNFYTSDTSGGYYGCVFQQDGTVWIWRGNDINVCKVFNPKDNSATSYAPTYGGFNNHHNGCLLPDGRTLIFPIASAVGGIIVIWNNASRTNTTITLPGVTGTCAGACQLPDGRICLAPSSMSNVVIFDSSTGTSSNAFTLTGTAGCTLDVTGNIVFTPSTTTAGIVVWNPTTNVRSTISITGMTDAFRGAAVVPDGRIVFGPWTQNHIGVYNPLTYTYTSYAISVPADVNFSLAKTLPNGYVLFPPFNATYFGLFNPYTNTYSTFTVPGIGTIYGASVIPDGRIILGNLTATLGVPVLTGMNSPVPMEWCLHPFFNKCP